MSKENSNIKSVICSITIAKGCPVNVGRFIHKLENHKN